MQVARQPHLSMMISRQKWLLLIVVSLGLSLAVPLTLGGLSQFRLLHRLSAGIIFLLILLKLISWAFNALRVQVLVGSMGQEVGFGEAALTTVSAEFAGVTTPGGVGMAATYTFLFTRLGFSLGTAAGVVGLIMVTDLAVYGTVLPLAAIIQASRGAGLNHGLRLAGLTLLVVAGGAALVRTLAQHHRRVWNFVGRQMARIPWLARRRWSAGRVTVEFLHTFQLLGRMSWSQRSALFLIALNFWLPRFLLLVIIVHLVAPEVPFAYLVLMQGVLHTVGQASFIPGGAGVEDGGYAAFMAHFMGMETIAFTLLVWRFFNFYWYLFLGGPIFLYKVGQAAWDLLSKRA